MKNYRFPQGLDGLAACSRALGSDSLLVQGAGGNTSFKDGSVLWVKASGKWLAHAGHENLFLPVEMRGAGEALDAGREPSFSRDPSADARLRPSIETALHAALPHKAVLHVHAVAVLALAVRRDAEALLAARLSHLPWGFTAYVKPGWELARDVRRLWQSRPQTQIFVLGNHGLVVAADSFDEAYALIAETVAACEVAPRAVPAVDGDEARRWIEGSGHRDMKIASGSSVHGLALDPVCTVSCHAGVLYPDQAVFLGASLALNDDLAESRYRIVPGVGAFVSTTAPTGTEEMLRCHAEILLRVPHSVALRALTAAQIDALLDWDAEKYRQGKAS